MLTYTLKIENIIKETSDTVTICFKQPALKKIKYQAGQYLTLIFRINGRRYIRPYSFSSAPGVDTTLNVTVKRVLGGIVSNHILDRLNVGDIIEVMEPMGNFVLQNETSDSRNRIILWGSGSGITPIMSIAKYALNQPNYNHITLIYGNRNFETTIFAEQIKYLQNKYPEKFTVWHFHTRAVLDNVSLNIITGRIDPEKMFKVMEHESDTVHTVHYICGPAGLKDSVKKYLIKSGIDTRNIFSEDFEVTRDPKAFEDIYTQNVAINIKGKTSIFEVPKGKSILEAGLDASLDITYSCQTGNCLLCKAKLLSGKIKVIGIEKVPDEIRDGECLLCCGFPLTNNIEILIPN